MMGFCARAARQSATHLQQQVHDNVWHALHVLREQFLNHRRQLLHHLFRIHALDSGNNFSQNLSAVVLDKRGRYRWSCQACVDEEKHAIQDAFVTRCEGDLNANKKRRRMLF
jgi:hypothetical protein